jgi:UDP-N-acetylglucosamine/UDP-N-acetylgalactosamine 4-epimerase
MTTYEQLKQQLEREPKVWLVTGAAGFIGSNLVEALLKLNQTVVGLDDLSTGSSRNLLEVKEAVAREQWARFQDVNGDIRDLKSCSAACQGVNYVLHQAALGSVPLSIADPLTSHECNVNGFLNMLLAARDAGVKRFVFASSCAVYGDSPELPKREDHAGKCLSPYAATKYANESYADVFSHVYGMQYAGLRYFNVFGPRQHPDGPYAAVIPKWISAMLNKNPVYIYGDGSTSRDFCYITNVVQANLLAALTENPDAVNQIYNVAVGARTTLNELFSLMRDRLLPTCPHVAECKPVYHDFREGDVRHSLADISRARELLGYSPTHMFRDGLDEALEWYRANSERRAV